jgi:KUP system potassium uptake protein
MTETPVADAKPSGDKPAKTPVKSHTSHDHAGGAHAPKIATMGDLAKVSLGALGVVYGDIGTSVLYAMKECFAAPHGLPVARENILGIVSLVFWSLTATVVVKYLTFVMTADNHGEGGILALLALLKAPPTDAEKAAAAATGTPLKKAPAFAILTVLGLFGAALLYGDGMITPSLSVLSAVEGLEVATTKLKTFVIPITLVVLVGLFVAQKGGTAKIGAIFGPTMLVWFVAIAAIGMPWILKNPSVLAAVNPKYALHIFIEHKWHGFLILGSVVLCITGGEALYADMGHFGKRPIRIAWYTIVYPALLINYFGQAALLLAKPEAAENPFYNLIGGWMLYPLVVIATFATVVASQALISGAFSLTQQAVQLGYWPRVTIVHTSGEAEGQIYIPEINNILLVACVCLVVGFKSSTAMAGAYGIAVTGTMGVTSILFYAVARQRWGWSFLKAGPLVALFLVIDLSFFGANAVKVLDGGWFPLAIGAAVLVIMLTWHRGRAVLYEFIKEATLPLDVFLADVRAMKPYRVAGTAVFMTSNPEGAPPVLLHHFKHNKVLHERVVLLSIATRHQPEVPVDERIVSMKDLGDGFYQVTAAFGFMQSPNVQEALHIARKKAEFRRSEKEAGNPDATGAAKAYRPEPADTSGDLGDDISFFLGRETLIERKNRKMASWRKKLFIFLSKNARPANAFFRIPPNRVVELGTQIEL